MKEILFGTEALTRIRKGINIATDAVNGTLGAKGRNVFLDDPLMPNVTNDGVTIASTITLKDKFENMGAYLVKNASSQTNDTAGDGTTTTSVLLRALVDLCFNRPEHPMIVEASLKDALKDILPKLKDKARKVVSYKDINRIALISSKSPHIATLITDIIKKKGKDTLITVDDSRTFDTYTELTTGYEAGVGYISPYCVNDAKTQKAIHKDVKVFCSEKRISSVGDIKALFDQLDKASITSLVMVVEDIELPVLGILIQNKLQGRFNPLIIKAQGQLLEDIAYATGSTLVSDKTGITFSSIDIKKHLGLAEAVVSDEKKTLFVANHASARAHAKRLEAQRAQVHNEIEKKSLDKRISKLKGAIAVIKVGAPTDLEREYLKYKAEDAVHAVKSALEEGIVEGGGLALYSLSESIKPTTVGLEILKKALTAPIRTIIENSGKDYIDVIKHMPKGLGYNVETYEYTDMIKAGIIDPVKVERVALENAVGTASKFITMHAAIADKPNDNEKTK